MIRSLNVVAVIPARGGSKGLPGKNVIDLCGKPLIAYTIEAALQSKYIDRVVVSTDAPHIAKIARRYGAEVPFLRPRSLALDTAHTPPVIIHAIRFLEKHSYGVDIVVTLQPTSPLRESRQIDQAIERLVTSRCGSVASAKPAEYPPYWLVKIRGHKAIPFVNDGVNYFNKERQQLPKTYQLNGAIYVTRKNRLLESGNIITERCGIVLMDDITSSDIDTYSDLEKIAGIVKKRRSRYRGCLSRRSGTGGKSAWGK